MENLHLLLTLAVGLTFALLLGFVTQRVGLSPIVGYLFAGIVVGPHTPGFVADHHLAEQLAEIGVILLMFGVGLQFHLNELLAVRRVAIPGAIVQSLVATVLGAVVVHAFGWGWTAGLVFGAALSVASTVVLTRVLTDFRDLHTPTGHIAIGWLVVEDLFTVLVLVLLPALFGDAGGVESETMATGAANGPAILMALGLAMVKVAVLGGIILVGGGRVVPWLLDRVAATRSRELFTLTVLVLALGVAAISALFFNVSVALGAFLAGMAVGRSEFSLRAASEALPMRDAFAVLFFVSVGMLLNPGSLLEAPTLTLSILAVVLVGKPAAAFAIVWLLRYPPKVAIAVAVALAQIGEFSFMLATLGIRLNLMTDAAMNVLVAVAIISITLNPLLYRLIDPLDAWLSKRPALWRLLTARVHRGVSAPAAANASGHGPAIDAMHHAVVVGYGPVGQTVARLLRENEIESTIVELNMETVRRLNDEGMPAVYGDASRAETLRAAGVEHARNLILSASDLPNSEEVIRVTRELNPRIRILSRVAYSRQLPALRRAGADTVFSAEGEVALAMTEAILRMLGATPDQIDRERERVHAELIAPAAAEAH